MCSKSPEDTVRLTLRTIPEREIRACLSRVPPTLRKGLRVRIIEREPVVLGSLRLDRRDVLIMGERERAERLREALRRQCLRAGG